jgi:hypothetical protein
VPISRVGTHANGIPARPLKRLRSAPRAEAPNPVMFRAGRFWLRAIARGSPAAAITNGTVSVAEHAASAAGVPGITMTSTCKLTNSLASSASVAATRRTIFEGEVLPLGIAMLEKHLLEGGKIDVTLAGGRVQKPDTIASDRRDSRRGPRLRKKLPIPATNARLLMRPSMMPPSWRWPIWVSSV